MSDHANFYIRNQDCFRQGAGMRKTGAIITGLFLAPGILLILGWVVWQWIELLISALRLLGVI